MQTQNNLPTSQYQAHITINFKIPEQSRAHKYLDGESLRYMKKSNNIVSA